jgi:opacity protein-like surface antigen
MKKIFLTAAFAVAVASPAFAATSHHLRNSNAANATYAQEAYAVDADTVVSDGKVLGRDPDAFIRLSLLREGDRANDNGGAN